MTRTVPAKIAISSAGHRTYLFDWFRDALRRLGVPGEVVALDYEPLSAAFHAADRGVVMPAYNAASYPSAMREWFAAERPSVFLSLNDYEHGVLAVGLGEELRRLGCAVGGATVRPDVVADKFLLAAILADHAVETPATYLGADFRQLLAGTGSPEKFVVKHRFGSGSSGLRIVGPEGLELAIADASRSALNAEGLPVPGDVDRVIVQPWIRGAEYGVDAVFSLDGVRHDLLGALARRKLRMRSGDTDRAITVDSAPFWELARALGQILEPCGLIDMDVIINEGGNPCVIDINPRFGGGYPVMHLAGADAPRLLLQSALGLPVDPQLLTYELGVTAARTDAFTVVAREGQVAALGGSETDAWGSDDWSG